MPGLERLLRRRLSLVLFPVLSRLVPRRWVFRAGLVFGAVVSPYHRRVLAPGTSYRDSRDRLLCIFLAYFTRMGRSFDLPYRISGLDRVRAAHRRHGGVILCSCHLGLNFTIHRALAPLGVPTAVVAGAAFPDLPCTLGIPTAPAPRWLPESRELMLRVRAALREGRIVLLVIDRREPAGGQLLLSPGIFRFAARARVPVLFFATRLDGHRHIDVALAPPHPDGDGLVTDLPACLGAFQAFMRPFVADIDRARWVRWTKGTDLPEDPGRNASE